MYRMSIAQWQEIWTNDRAQWSREIRDRPARFDPLNWKKAVRLWRNEIPRDTDRPFAGVPFVVKDLFDVVGETTCSSSRLFLQDCPPKPAAADAAMVRRLKNLGAHPAGRTHMNEFAYGLDGKNSYTGDCPHPLDSTRISGGSSSGSAWAVGAGVVPLALGTDTGGSVRVPAALCGIFGYRPAWNPIDNEGVFPLAPSFDTAGWFTACASDMAQVLRELIDGFRNQKSEKPARYCYFLPPGVVLEPSLASALDVWKDRVVQESRGAVHVEPAPPDWTDQVDRIMQDSLDAYNIRGSSEAWGVHKDWLDAYRDSYQPLVWSLIDRGRHWSLARVEYSATVVSAMKKRILELLDRFDGILIPATPVATPAADRVDAAFREQTIRLNAPGSMSGTAILSAPVHLDAIRSGGMQILVAPGREYNLQPLLETLVAGTRVNS